MLSFVTEHIAIILVTFVLIIALVIFLAARGSSHSMDQSPAAKQFRKQLKEINLDLDKD